MEYLYSVTDIYHAGTETNTLTVRIFLSGQKKTPLIIEFLTSDDYFMGQPLQSGIILINKITSSEDEVNLMSPGIYDNLSCRDKKKAGQELMQWKNKTDWIIWQN